MLARALRRLTGAIRLAVGLVRLPGHRIAQGDDQVHRAHRQARTDLQIPARWPAQHPFYFLADLGCDAGPGGVGRTKLTPAQQRLEFVRQGDVGRPFVVVGDPLLVPKARMRVTGQAMTRRAGWLGRIPSSAPRTPLPSDCLRRTVVNALQFLNPSTAPHGRPNRPVQQVAADSVRIAMRQHRGFL